MRKETFTKENFMDMDPMHDAYTSKIYNDGNTLIIEYEELDDGINEVLDPKGNSIYKDKKVTIKYECQKCEQFSLCDMILCSSRNNKFRYIEFDEFIKTYKDYTFESYKFALDSFGGLTLYFWVHKYVNDKLKKVKYDTLIIDELYPIKIEYIWE